MPRCHRCAPAPMVLPALALLGLFCETARAQFVEPGVSAIHTWTGSGTFGWAVADLDDIDGDGVRDAIIGAPLFGGSPRRVGKVSVYSGRTGALLHTFTGIARDWQLGYAVADAGDVNADTVPDIIAGGPVDGAGRAQVFSGAGGALLWTLNGEAALDNFGAAVSGAGDVDGDGHADVAVGAPGNDGAGAGAGRVYIYSGQTGLLIRSFDGPVGGGLGSGLANAGDVNQDGKTDLIASAPGAGPAPVGRAYVYSGADGSLLLPALIPDQPTTGAYGVFFVAGLGDVDHDGTTDLYVGDYADATNGAGAGKAYVYSGATGGLLRTIIGPAGAGLGPGRGAGDVNRDGHADLIIGSYTSALGAANAGRIEVFSGADGALLRSMTHTVLNGQLGFDAVGLGDVNGDCAIDFLCSAASGNVVYVIAGFDAPIAGDMNCDCAVNLADVEPFVLALLDPVAYALAHGGCDIQQADLNQDLVNDGLDVAGFVAGLLSAAGP